MMITTADVTDRKGAIDMVSYYRECTDNLSQIKKMLVDGGYTGQNFADAIKEITGAEVEVVKRNELQKLRLLSAMNYIPLLFFPNAGLWSVLSVG